MIASASDDWARADRRLFVHRVRDADPNIRTDCLKELGVWVRKYPDLYTSNSFLQYLSRGTHDPVRIFLLHTY